MISIIALSLAAAVLPPDVTGVSVSPVADRTEVVIRVDGTVSTSDFLLADPARVVLDLSGMANVRATQHNVGRGGVRSVRIAPFQPGVVRVVIDLENAVDYDVQRTGDEVRISFPNLWGSFEPWNDDAAPQPSQPAPQVEQAVAVSAPVVQQQPPIHVTFTEEPLANVIAAFADFANRSIIAEADVKGKLITAEIRNQPWDLALEAILAANNLVAQENEAGVIIVRDASQLVLRQTEEPLVSRQFPVSFVNSDTLVRAVQGMVSQRGRVVSNTTTNTLVVTDAASVLDQIAPLIAQLDQRAPQVNISATIAFVDRTALEQLGVTYDVKDSRGNQLNQLVPGLIDEDGDGDFEQTEENVVLLGGNSVAALANANYPVPSPAIQIVSSLVLGRHTLVSFLEALQSITLSDIQAKPTITVMNHRQAEIQVGQRTPIRVIEAGTGGATGGQFPRATVDYQDTGVILRVTPHITGSQILLDLIAERSDAVPASSDIGFVFNRQNATTQVLVEDGETTVIGGLTIVDKSQVRTGIPLLMDLPVIGALFRNTREQESKRDLLIMVTPHIVRD